MNETITSDRVYKSDQPDRNITHIISSVLKQLSISKMIVATSILSLILALSAAQPNGYAAPSYAASTYAAPSYAAPS